MTRIICGDCLVELPKMAANSIDSIITDPPYELGFMGKTWDKSGVAFKPETWAACLRVAKPGTMLLCFGGTRTFHRLACAIEDAGWEIRDTIGYLYGGPLLWVYAQGFPKSHNFGCKCRGGTVQCGHENNASRSQVRPLPAAVLPSARVVQEGKAALLRQDVCVEGKAEASHDETLPGLRDCVVSQNYDAAEKKQGLLSNMRGTGVGAKETGEAASVGSEAHPSAMCRLSSHDGAASVRIAEGKDSDLFQTLQRKEPGEGAHSLQRKHEGPEAEGQTVRGRQSGLERRRDVLAEARELQADKVRPLSAGLPTDGAEGRIHHGASVVDGAGGGATPGAERGSPPQESRPTGQPIDEPRIVPEQRGAQTGGRVCPKCGGLIDFAGYGSALKPAFEPIIVAMKPCEGTFAQNAIRHGVAGLNVDGCRIVTGDDTGRAQGADIRGGSFVGSAKKSDLVTQSHPAGRWPSNLIHNGSAEVLAGFPCVKAGIAVRRNKGHSKSSNINYATGSRDSEMRDDIGYGDSGSAARFFYCAKSSRAEREAGLAGLAKREIYPQNNSTDRKELNATAQERVRNHHPTVKPLALMRYLCRLTKTPTGGVVLDPFCGSGTTGMACALEGREFIGIELSAEYVEIARRRIASVNGALFATAAGG